jgi:DNA polymerase-3 subunit gamma/tau
MENFIVSARKYRPLEFDTVVGQSHITDTLEHAIDNNQLAQALLFCGPRGVGKTTCARILARKINEKSGASDDTGFAFNIYELDAASNNSVDDIRELIDQVRFALRLGNIKYILSTRSHAVHCSIQCFS